MAAKWYYQDPSTEERAGPVKVEFVRNLIETGVVQDDTLVWTKGMVDWVSPERERERGLLSFVGATDGSLTPRILPLPFHWHLDDRGSRSLSATFQFS